MPPGASRAQARMRFFRAVLAHISPLQTLYPPPPPTMAFEMKPMSTWKAMSPKMTWLGFGLGLGLGLGVRLGLGFPLTLTKPPS